MTSEHSTTAVFLREVVAEDLRHFFDHQLDARANHMAAFTAVDPSDEAAFVAHWRHLRSDPSVLNRTIVQGGDVVGHIASFPAEEHREITYWIDPAKWGRGYASEALRQFLLVERTRPLYARAASDNLASLRILEKHGFQTILETISYANARNADIAETLLELPSGRGARPVHASNARRPSTL
jgi:RimJ/RimL family protein N-acetyltransferase